MSGPDLYVGAGLQIRKRWQIGVDNPFGDEVVVGAAAGDEP